MGALLYVYVQSQSLNNLSIFISYLLNFDVNVRNRKASLARKKDYRFTQFFVLHVCFCVTCVNEDENQKQNGKLQSYLKNAINCVCLSEPLTFHCLSDFRFLSRVTLLIPS